jgi:hypothetical protein
VPHVQLRSSRVRGFPREEEKLESLCWTRKADMNTHDRIGVLVEELASTLDVFAYEPDPAADRPAFYKEEIESIVGELESLAPLFTCLMNLLGMNFAIYSVNCRDLRQLERGRCRSTRKNLERAGTARS